MSLSINISYDASRPKYTPQDVIRSVSEFEKTLQTSKSVDDSVQKLAWMCTVLQKDISVVGNWDYNPDFFSSERASLLSEEASQISKECKNLLKKLSPDDQMRLQEEFQNVQTVLKSFSKNLKLRHDQAISKVANNALKGAVSAIDLAISKSSPAPYPYGAESKDKENLPIVDTLPDRAKLPKKGVLKMSNEKILRRTRIATLPLKEVLGWKFNRDNQSAIEQLFSELAGFESYLNNSTEVIKSTYLNQGSDFATKLLHAYTHHFTLDEQMLVRDFFQDATRELQRLDKRFKR